MGRDVSVRELAADNVLMGREGSESRWTDGDVVGDGGVVIASRKLGFEVAKGLVEGFRERVLHHDRYGRAVSDGCIPGYEAFLCDRRGKIAWSEDKSPLAAAVLCVT